MEEHLPTAIVTFIGKSLIVKNFYLVPFKPFSNTIQWAFLSLFLIARLSQFELSEI